LCRLAGWLAGWLAGSEGKGEGEEVNALFSAGRLGLIGAEGDTNYTVVGDEQMATALETVGLEQRALNQSMGERCTTHSTSPQHATSHRHLKSVLLSRLTHITFLLPPPWTPHPSCIRRVVRRSTTHTYKAARLHIFFSRLPHLLVAASKLYSFLHPSLLFLEQESSGSCLACCFVLAVGVVVV
jgi:hypothetical protein